MGRRRPTTASDTTKCDLVEQRMQTLHELGAHQRDPLRASVARSELLEHVRGFFERYDLPALPGAQVWPRINGRATDSCHCWMEVTFAALLHAAQA